MPRQITFIDQTAAIGGAEINLLLLVPQLSARGWEVKVILPEQGPFSSRLTQLGITIEHIPGVPDKPLSFHVKERKLPNPLAWAVNAWSGLLWSARLLSYLRRNNEVIVHTVSFWAHVCGGLAARLAKMPVISHFQELVGSPLHKVLIRAWAHYIPSSIVCISPRVAEQFTALPSIKSKTSVILNTIDVENFTPASSAHNTKIEARSPLRIGTIARLIPWKGQHVAVKAADMLREKLDFEWTFVGNASLGSPAYAERVKSLVRQFGLETQIKFRDWIEDTPEFYRSLDVLVHIPIEPEPFGLVLGEAMACGIPVITTAGGAEALVRAGAGYVVPANDAAAVASSLAALADDPEERSIRGQRAREIAVQTFSVSQYVDQWIDTYEAVREEAPL